MFKFSKKVFALAFCTFLNIRYIQSFPNYCRDSIEYEEKCKTWALNGECIKSYQFMNKFCKKSCNQCPNKGNNP